MDRCLSPHKSDEVCLPKPWTFSVPHISSLSKDGYASPQALTYVLNLIHGYCVYPLTQSR